MLCSDGGTMPSNHLQPIFLTRVFLITIPQVDNLSAANKPTY